MDRRLTEVDARHLFEQLRRAGVAVLPFSVRAIDVLVLLDVSSSPAEKRCVS